MNQLDQLRKDSEAIAKALLIKNKLECIAKHMADAQRFNEDARVAMVPRTASWWKLSRRKPYALYPVLTGPWQEYTEENKPGSTALIMVTRRDGWRCNDHAGCIDWTGVGWWAPIKYVGRIRRAWAVLLGNAA